MFDEMFPVLVLLVVLMLPAMCAPAYRRDLHGVAADTADKSADGAFRH